MNLLFDLKYAWRLFRKSWGYSLMCAGVVALSVGLAVWTYTLLYSQILKPFPYPGSDRWYSVQISAEAGRNPRPSIDTYTWQELLEKNRSADHLGAFATRPAVLSEGQATTSLRGIVISPRLLQATRVAPLLGRSFAESDGQPGAGPVTILSYDTWQHYFAADPNIVGKTVRIDAEPVEIVGVMPKDFFVEVEDFELLRPLQPPALTAPQTPAETVFPVILLGENQHPDALVNEMKSVIAGINGDYPQLFHATRSVALVPAPRMFTHGITPIVTMMSLMGLGVLLLGCVNISMVFLARLLERSRELALRTALGAARSRLIRQSLLETALVVLLGLVVGYALATLGVEWTHGISDFGSRILATGRSSNLPQMRPVDLLIAFIFATAIWLFSTLIPAWRISRQDAAMVLAGSGKGATVRGSNRSVAFLVGLQVIISCLVLVICGNVVMALQKETSKPTGLDTASVTMSTYPTVFDSRFAEPSQRLRYWEALTSEIRNRVPGSDVAFTTAPPTRPASVPAVIETQQGSARQENLTLPLTVVSDNYFQLMGVRLRSGRLFDATDTSDTLDVAVVDEKMAARFWPEQDAIGKRVELGASAGQEWVTIVGVVSNVAGVPYRKEADLGAIYRPLRQVIPSAFQILIKLPPSAGDSRVALRAAAFAVDRDLPLHNLQKVDDYLAAIYLSYPAMIRVFLVIAVVTAFLAASGLFGLISRSVAQRTQEVGIRRALGATAWRSTSMFLRQGALYLTVAMAGLGLGIGVMPMLSRNIPNILELVVPVTAGVVLLMAAVISTASYLPTRRAVALEPGDALRYE